MDSRHVSPIDRGFAAFFSQSACMQPTLVQILLTRYNSISISNSSDNVPTLHWQPFLVEDLVLSATWYEAHFPLPDVLRCID